MRLGHPLFSGALPFRAPALFGLLLLAAPVAQAQSLGLSVNGSCEVGACPPATPLAVDTSAFVPYAFTITEENGDSYGFAGQIGEQDLNGATSLPGSMAITITYLGNAAGGPSRGTSFTTHVFYDFTANTSGSYALVADTGGSFSGGIGDGTSVTGLWTFDGTIQSSTFGPFVPPESFYQSETDNVPAPADGVLTADVLTTVVFGAGSPVGSIIAVGAAPADVLAAAVLPGARSVQVGSDATVFATMLNANTVAMTDCQVSLRPSAPADLQLTYQTTDPATNALIGTPNTPATITPGGAQTFLLDFHATSAFTVSDLPLFFDCDDTNPAADIAGVNTIDLLFSATPIPDIIALAATATNDGTIHVAGGNGAFAVATVDVGAAGDLTVSADTGTADLPASIELCQTTATGQCLSPPSAAVPVSFASEDTPTFSIFVSSSAAIPFAPGSSRVFVRFKDGGGASHGSTSVAVTTD